MAKNKNNPTLEELLVRYSQNDVIAEMEREYASATSRNIPLSSIDDNHIVKKVLFPKETIDALGESLKEKGFFSPLVVRPSGNHYELILGRKRFVGAKKAKIEYVPCIIKDVSDEEMLLTLLADVRDQRDGNVVEMALIFDALRRRFKYSQETLGNLAHLSRSQVTNALRLLHLPDSILKEVMYGKLSYGHARAIASLSDEKIEDVVKRIHDANLSVRETESLAREMQNGKKSANEYKSIKKQTGANKVIVKNNSITLSFSNEEEMQKCLQILEKATNTQQNCNKRAIK